MNNRNPVKQWSITFPQSGDIERKEFADMFPPRDEVIVCQEEHADGGMHLHMGLKLKKGLTKKKMLDYIKHKFKNDYKRIDVQATRSINCWNDYLSKEDPDVYREVSQGAREKDVAKVRKMIMDWGFPDPEDEVVPYEKELYEINVGELSSGDLELIKAERGRQMDLSYV